MAKTNTKSINSAETATAQVTTAAEETKTAFTFSAAPAKLQNDYKTRAKVAKFYKVSYEQWKKDMHGCGMHLPESQMKEA